MKTPPRCCCSTPPTLPDPGRIDLLVAFERHLALLQAAQQQVLAALDGRALDRSGTKLIDYTREQVGAALRLSPGTAEHRLATARTLVERLPATLNLLRTGQRTYLHARKLALCSRHHNAKHDAGWRVKRRPDGTSTWTSPTGHRYARPPDG